ncbi:MAG: hypothetical protein J5548_05515 [Prevotella sp.]|nr:hypothetical protein [Prevotella sp.]
MKNKSAFSSFMARTVMMLFVALLGSTQGVWGKDFITDVMVIGNSDKTKFYNLENNLKNQGWIAIDYDLNKGCGDGSDYIHLLYKKQSSSGSSGTPITDFYIKTGKNPPQKLSHDGRTYYRVSCQGSEDFVNSYGDLNNNAVGDYIFLYYTKDALPDYNAVTGITFNDTKSGALGANGGTTGYDLNAGCGSGTAYIYMHVTKSRAPVELTSSTAKVTLIDGDVVFGMGGQETHVTIADGATVTLSGVDITAIPNDDSHKWPGITCLGDANIILAEGTTNKVKGGRDNSGIFVPEGHTLTISGDGSLDAKGSSNGAGIGGGFQISCGKIVIKGGNITATGLLSASGIGSSKWCSCGDIVIEGGNITATATGNSAGIGSSEGGSCNNIVIDGGNITATGGSASAGIGSGYNGSCGDIVIGDGIIRVNATMGGNAWTAIGPGIYGSCGNITIAPSIIDLNTGKTRMLFHLQPFNSSNDKLYTLTSKRGGLVMNAEGTGLAAGQTRTNAPDEDKRFAIITYDGKQYLYSPRAKMFLRHDGTFVRRLESPIIIDGSIPYGDYKYMMYINNDDGALLAFNNKDNNIEINDWYTPDDGNRWRIDPVADFDPSEVLSRICLNSETGEVTFYDGDVITGTGGMNTHVFIADGATVTLSGVDITAIPNDDSHKWPGITCLGDANIILADGTTNKVKGGRNNSGIFVPEGHTLTISGEGSLDAKGDTYGAGIGSGHESPCGNIVIKGGNITATGDDYSAGIGSGDYGSCGDIVIKGGNITATGGYYPAGIGSGYRGSCGDIVIEGGNITAIGTGSSTGIGSGYYGSCGDIVIGDGIIRVTATMGGFAWTAIGPGIYGSCGTITIAPSIIDLNTGKTRVLFPIKPFNSSNDKLYTLTSKRGGLVMNAEGTGLAAGQARTNAPDEDKRFAIINYDGKQYLYSPRAKMFLRHDGTFVRRLGTPIIIDGNNPDGDYQYMLFMKNDDGALLAFNNNNNNIEINDWHTPDDGNRWHIKQVADFDPKEALLIAGLKLHDNGSNAEAIAENNNSFANVVLSGRTLYRDGTWNTLCLPFDVNDFAGTPLEGFTVMELDTETALNGHKTGFDMIDIAYYLNFKPATSIKAGTPYIVRHNAEYQNVIGSTDDWNAFATNVANGTTYEGQVVHLVADITVSTMVGTSDHRFKGTFDGQGHLLTLANLPATGQYCAPFRYVDGATIKNLHTTGKLTASDKYRSGLIGEIRNKVTISNCWSSVTINSSVNGDGTHGGFIGEVKSGGDVVIDNCLFDGSFTGTSTNCWGGFVGWSQGSTTINNSAFLPQSISSLDSSSSMTFGRNNVNIVNCYYSVALGEAQGKPVGNKTAELLAAALGNDWQVEDGKVVPVIDKKNITDPVFYGVTVKNIAPTAVTSADGAVTFTGSYNPVTLRAKDHTKLFLAAANTLHHPNVNMTVGSCRASFQLAISSKGDVNSDGGLTITDVTAMVEHIIGADDGTNTFVAANADLNGDGVITVTDVAVLVGMIADESQNLNIEVYSGDIPITYKGDGNGATRVKKIED